MDEIEISYDEIEISYDDTMKDEDKTKEQLIDELVELRRKAAESDAIIAAIGDGIIIQDTDFKIIYQNQIQNDLYGDRVGEYCYRTYEQKDTVCEGCPVELSFRDGKIHRAERSMATDSGMLYFELTGSPLRDSTGKIIAGIKVVRDITESKRMEYELRERERFLSSIFASIQDGIGIIDKDMNVIRVNPTVEKWYPHSMPIVGKKCYEAYHNRSERCEMCPAWRTLKTGEFGYEIIPKSGPWGESIGWLEIYSFPMIDSTSGQMRGIIEYVRDITKQKQAEEALHRAHSELELRVQERTADLIAANEKLQQSEEKYRILIDNSQDGVFIIQDAKIQFINEAFARIVGYTQREITGKDFRELVAPEDLVMVADRYFRRQRGEEIPKEYEFRMLRKDGTRAVVNMNVGLVTYLGRVASMGTVKDITEKKKLELQLLQSQRMESIGTLASGMAHDLNNVLTPITLALQILQEKFTDEQSQRLLNILEINTQRGANLIKQVMSFVRGIEGEHVALQVANIIAEIEKVAKETFPRSIEIKTDIQKDLFMISGDATQLHQVLMNICVNARDAMPDGGILSIRAENLFIDENYAKMNIEAKVGQYITIAISDTGVGIPPKILGRIFEPFFTTKQFGEGTGLGLSTALGIIKGHGGFIYVYSEIEKGTMFKICLPAIKDEVQKAEAQKYELHAGHGELILIVDDEIRILEVTRATLEKYGYRVLTANDGAEAVELYMQNRDDVKVVLMDMMMPIMDGPASIQALHQINPQIKIIAVSGLTEKDRLTENIGTKTFLTKPYTTKILLKTIHDVLKMR